MNASGCVKVDGRSKIDRLRTSYSKCRVSSQIASGQKCKRPAIFSTIYLSLAGSRIDFLMIAFFIEKFETNSNNVSENLSDSYIKKMIWCVISYGNLNYVNEMKNE